MKAKFVYESMRDILKPKSSKEIETEFQRLENKYGENIIVYELPFDYTTIEDLKSELKIHGLEVDYYEKYDDNILADIKGHLRGFVSWNYGGYGRSMEEMFDIFGVEEI